MYGKLVIALKSNRLEELGSCFFLLSFVIFLAKIPAVKAQIVPDNTLPVNTIVTPSGNIYIIEGGTPNGNNLFHSFQEFSLPTNTQAFFNNGLDIQNIFTRITGNSISNIDGLIRANGVASLFLINPNGIIFGPNARLNIGGSFFASTASSIKFNDGIEFSTTNPAATPLLNINVPIGLQLGTNPKEISVRNVGNNLSIDPTNGRISGRDSLVGLQVQPGKSLALIGGRVTFDGGILQAPGGRVELGGLIEAGTIGINADDSFSFPEGVQKADVLLANRSALNAIGFNGGSITINAQNLDILEGSFISSGIGENLGSLDARSGDITLNATGVINIGQLSIIDNQLNANALGNAGNINIQARALTLTNGSGLTAGTFGQGNAGSIKITASDTISLDGVGNQEFLTGIFSLVAQGAVGNAGGIDITTKSLTANNGALLSTSTFGQGNAGSVRITASDTISFDGGGNNSNSISSNSNSINSNFSGASSSVQKGAVGQAGGVDITTRSLRVSHGARLNTSTFGQGDAGSIKITANDTVSFDGVGINQLSGVIRKSAAISTVESGAIGNAGGIDITTRSLTVTNGARLSTSTLGQGNAGNIEIRASDTVLVDGVSSNGFFSAMKSSAAAGAVGNGGNIDITTGSLLVTNGAELNTSTLGHGNAGTVRITASDNVLLDGVGSNGNVSGVRSSVEQNGLGNAGGVVITTRSLSLTNGAQLAAGTFGQGDGGSVKITASDTISLDGVGSNGISTSIFSGVAAGAIGQGGGIDITTGSLSLTNGAQLAAGTFGQGDAGTVTITASDTISLDGVGSNNLPTAIQSIVSEGAVGKAGGVIITTGSLAITKGALLNASTLGQEDGTTDNDDTAGNITVEANSIVLNNQGIVQANTSSAKGNITMRSNSLILRENSQIATNAQGENVIGGNISIDADVIAALGNSDISANSVNSKGGNVTINAQSIFGAQPRTREELQSLLNTNNPNLLDPRLVFTNDITATGADSSLSGTVAVNTPAVDPSSGLVKLSANLIDATNLVASSCSSGRESNQFTITGRGGLPSSPNETINDEATWIDLRARTGEQERGSIGNYRVLSSESSVANSQIIEAQGWRINSQGKIELLAQSPTAISHSPGLSQYSCHAP